MNTKNLKLNMHFFALLCLFASSSFCKANIRHEVKFNNEEAVIKLVKEFLDTNQSKKPFPKFVDEISQMLGGNPAYKEFCDTLKKLRNSKSELAIGAAFLRFQKLLPESIKEIIRNKKKEELLKIIRARVQSK